MFDSLDEQMAKDDAKVTTPKKKVMMWVVITLGTAVLFGGLYFGVQLIGG